MDEEALDRIEQRLKVDMAQAVSVTECADESRRVRFQEIAKDRREELEALKDLRYELKRERAAKDRYIRKWQEAIELCEKKALNMKQFRVRMIKIIEESRQILISAQRYDVGAASVCAQLSSKFSDLLEVLRRG